MDPVFRAIADPTRRALLERLARADVPAQALGDGFRMSRPAISQHLRILREAGLVEARRSGRQQVYRLRPQALSAVSDWVRRFETFWNERIDDLEAVLDAMPDEESDHV